MILLWKMIFDVRMWGCEDVRMKYKGLGLFLGSAFLANH